MAFFALPPSGNATPPAFLLRAGDPGFAASFAEHIGRNENGILLTDSGTSALYVVFRAVAALRGRGGRGRVAVPAWCCPSVPQAALQAGLEPVLVDLDATTLAYAPDSLEAARAHPSGLAAVLLVHFFGREAVRPGGDWGEVLFIRDCAQDFDYNPAPLESAPCIYSFGRGKALNAGHGGALCLPPPGPFADACRGAYAELSVSGARPLAKALAINVLSRPRLYWAVRALPGLGIGATVWDAPLSFARLSPAFPRLGSACLEGYLQRRNGYRGLIARYRALALACDPARARAAGAALESAGTELESVPVRFPLLFEDAALREQFHAAVKARFGGVTRMYPAILAELPGAPRDLAGADGDPYDPKAFPGARRVAREILTLPVAADLMGREDAFLAYLEGLLRKAGALRAPVADAKGMEPGGARAGSGTEVPAGAEGRDWAPGRERVSRPALFPAP
ncbi:MAG: DegT/DnrJ/EryC1/StrS family aminotransferase [Fibrobacteres bacterium]|nr:DegT/DnrJ/EryC1/StrS family aminotransferase [Fibrobacterota bacterium]